MDLVILKKKLSTYVSPKGQLRNLNDDILYEVISAWENWTGSATEFYRTVGFTQKQMAGVVGKAKKLKREGRFGTSEFKPVSFDTPPAAAGGVDCGPCAGAEIVWNNGRVIRFSEVDLLVDFLKKSA